MVVRALAPSVDQPKFSEGRAMPEAELKRLAAESRREPGANWKRWEPYLAERQWRTVREDYSKDGRPWLHFTHEVSIWPLIAGEKIAVGHYQSSVQALLPTRVVEMVSIRFLRAPIGPYGAGG